MSTILVDNLTGKTTDGDITVTSEGGAATMQLQQGLAKHWSNFEMAATFVANDSFNQSSLTDVAAGTAAPVFTNNMANTTYSDVAMTTEITTSGDLTNKTAATYRIYGLNSANAAADPTENCTIVVGDLA
jgi:hypothetical protein